MMANIDNAFRTGYTLRIGWWTNSQDVAGNYSNITAVVYLISTGSSYNINASATKYGSLYIDGSTYNFTFNATLSGGQTKELFRKTVNIYHGSDGTKTFKMYATAGINVTLSGTYWGTVRVPSSGESNCSLTTIPRRSTITSITGETFNASMTVNIDQKSSNFTTSVYVKTPNSEWINVIWKQSGTSFTFILPASLMETIPQATSCTGMVKIRTYNGDTEIGDDDWNRWMGVPDWVVPTISEVYHGTNTQVDKSWIYVKNKSKMLVRTTANSSYGAWITSIRVDYDGVQYWGSEIWTNVQNISGNRPLTVHVWDSRGRYSSWTGNIFVHDYGKPWGSINAYRCDEDGSRNDASGTRIKVVYSGNRYLLDGSNTFWLTISHRITGGNWSNEDVATGVAGSGEIILDNGGELFSLEKTYEIRLRIWDWFTYVDYIAPISTAFVLMDFKAGGKGLGIGRVATEDNFAQFATGVKLFSGRDNRSDVGADLIFANCGDEAVEIGICGAPPSSTNEILNIYRFTNTASGNEYAVWSVTKYNDIINRAKCNYTSGNTVYQNPREATIMYDGAPTYQFFNPTWCGYYDNSAGEVWSFNYGSKVLRLRGDYTTSDERKKYNIDEFTNWDDFYNFYMSLKPVTFKYNEDMIEDTHIGFIAQDVADSIIDNNLANDKLAIVKCLPNEDYDDGREYNVCYKEMIALNTKMIQKHEKEIQELNTIISKQQDTIEQLKDMIDNLTNQGGE